MSTRDDVSKLYIIPSILERIETGLFILDILAAFIAVISEPGIVSIAIIIQIISALLYFVLSVVDDGYFWYEAEKARRKNAVEDGFGVRLSELETEEYYNNPNKESIEKYALNTLESNLFSKCTAGMMILPSCVKSCIAIVVLVIACRFLTDPELLLIIAQATFSSYVLLDSVKLVLYKCRMDVLFKEGYAIMISPRIKGRGKNAIMLAYAIEYEAIKAHYKVRLNTKSFKRNNDRISKEWETILSHRA